MNIIQTVELGLFCHFRPLSYVAPTSICYQLIYTTHWQRCTCRVLLYRIWSNPTLHLSDVKLLWPHPDFWRPLIITDKWLIRQLGHSDRTCFPSVCWIGQISTFFYIYKNGLTNQNFCSKQNVQWCTYNIFQNSGSLLIEYKKNNLWYHVAVNLAFQNTHTCIYIFSLTELSLTKCWFFSNVKFHL